MNIISTGANQGETVAEGSLQEHQKSRGKGQSGA